MDGLELWLKRATRSLSADSSAQVRGEIEEHFAAARDAAMVNGATESEAECSALIALGDAREANRQYRRVLLTKGEARMMRESSWEANAVCSRGWFRWFVSTTAIATGATGMWAWIISGTFLTPILPLLFLVSGGTAMIAAPMFLPLYTPLRGRAYRAAKWIAIAGMLMLLSSTPGMTWIFIACLGYSLWMEWTRASIRRKMPVERWPKHLYL